MKQFTLCACTVGPGLSGMLPLPLLCIQSTLQILGLRGATDLVDGPGAALLLEGGVGHPLVGPPRALGGGEGRRGEGGDDRGGGGGGGGSDHGQARSRSTHSTRRG